MMTRGLTADQVAFYRDNGYLFVDRFFDNDVIEAAQRAINDVLEEGKGDLAKVAELEPDDPTVVRRLWSPTDRHPFFLSLASDERLLDAIESLIGPNILLHYTKLNMKGAKAGSVVKWHQDFSYYPHTNPDLVTALIYIDEATIDNGCIQVLPGSNRDGLANHYVDGYFRGMVPEHRLDASKAKPLPGAPGSVAFLGCMTLHYSAPNQSEKRRAAFLPAYRAADAWPIYFGPHAAHNEPGLKLLRGKWSKTARGVAGEWLMPLPEAPFSSLYDVQAGSHIVSDKVNIRESGYAVGED